MEMSSQSMCQNCLQDEIIDDEKLKLKQIIFSGI